MERLQRNAPTFLLAGALLGAAILSLALMTKTTFFGDNWAFIITRRDLTVENLLHPHNEHIVLFPVLIFQALMRVFGFESARPEQVVLVALLIVTAALLFTYVRRRVGPWLALYATVLLLFLGPAFEVLLWPFEIGFVGSIMLGLAMLLALEREDSRGDVAACAFLALSLGFSSLGLAFVAAALVAVAIGPRDRWLRRAYVFVIPAVLYGIWYLGWGSDAENHFSLHNVLASPRFAVDSAAASVGALSGLGTGTGVSEGGAGDLTWSRIVLAALVVVLVARELRLRRGFNRWLWPAAAAAAANWFLTAFNAFEGRVPEASRYQYAGAVLVLLILANLLRDVRPSRNALIAGAVLVGLAVGPNLTVLRDGSRFFEAQAVLTRSDTAAIEIAQDSVAPDFELTLDVAGTPSLINIYAGEYLQAVREHGSPAYSEAELKAAPPEGRHWADVVLSQALPLSTVTRIGVYRGSGGGCVDVPGGGEGPAEVQLPPGTTRIEVAPGERAALSLRRFAEAGEFPAETNGAEGESTMELTIPPDRSPQPWQLHVEAEQLVRVCPPAGA